MWQQSGSRGAAATHAVQQAGSLIRLGRTGQPEYNAAPVDSEVSLMHVDAKTHMGATRGNAHELGRALARARAERDLTQRGLAAKAGLSPKSAGSISRLEKGFGGIPHRSTLERYLRALELDDNRRRELMLLAGYAEEMATTANWDAVVRLLAECANPHPLKHLDLEPLGPEALFEHGRLLERFQVAEAAVTLLRVAASIQATRDGAVTRSSGLPYALGISLLGVDDHFDEDLAARWESGLGLVLQTGAPVVEVFDLGSDDTYAVDVVTKVLRRLAIAPEVEYQARYFSTDPSRRLLANVLVAPGLAGLLFGASRDADIGSGPDVALTFRASEDGGRPAGLDRPGLGFVEGQFERIRRRESKRLLRVFSVPWEVASGEGQAEKALEWEADVAYDEESEADHFQVKRGLSRLLVPQDIWLMRVHEIWQGHVGVLDRLDRYAAYRRQRQRALMSQLGRFHHRSVATKAAVEALVDHGDATRLDDMLAGPDRRPLPRAIVRRVLESLLEHMRHGYELALLDRTDASQLPIFEWAVKDRRAVYLEVHSSKSQLRIILQPEALVRIFRAYFNDFWQGLPLAAKNQRLVQQYVRDQLNKLSDTA